MTTLEQIKETIANYDKISVLAEAKIKVLKELDNFFSTARGIENISFDNNQVFVSCDDTCMGCYDTIYFEFPLEYLTLEDAELTVVVEQARVKRMEEEHQKVQERELKEKQAKDHRELLEYERLKEKFDK